MIYHDPNQSPLTCYRTIMAYHIRYSSYPSAVLVIVASSAPSLKAMTRPDHLARHIIIRAAGLPTQFLPPTSKSPVTGWCDRRWPAQGGDTDDAGPPRAACCLRWPPFSLLASPLCCPTQQGASGGGRLKAVTLTRDHLALHAVERARIERSGGFVSADGRLNGKMQVSRSFGDAALKKVGTEKMGHLRPPPPKYKICCHGTLSVAIPFSLAVVYTTEVCGLMPTACLAPQSGSTQPC